MFKALSSCHDVTWVGYRNLGIILRVLIKVQAVLDNIFNIRRGYPYFNKRLAILKGKGLTKKIRASEFDIIVSPNSPDLVAHLHTSVPIIYIRDCTFQLFINYYPTFSNLTPKAIDEGNGLEQRAIDNAWRVVYSSAWAARSAIDSYGADPAKVSIINFGANLTECPPCLTEKPNQDVCNILFIGVDWQRKGGEIAMNTFQKLKSEGIRCKLTVAGCHVKLEQREDVETVPFLDKTKAVQLQRLTEMYSNAHFVILPTIADCTPIVFSEAAAFGVPVLATDTGGNSSVITDGVNGYLFAPGSNETDYANKIRAVFTNKTLYNELRGACRKEFDTRLSWNVWIRQINNLIEEAKNSVFKTADLVSMMEGKEKVVRG
jgi:glycosyltransferase involved in cell wall biosynthesis